MIVDVIWPMRNPECLARGYADCALLEQMFDHTIWTPPEPVEFRHHEVRDEFPDVPGAVVVFNGRHNAADADWLVESINKLPWSLCILAGDEEMLFPWQRIPETPTRKVWIMDPRPDQAHLSKLIPGGWYWNTREDIVAAGKQDRDLRFFFAGQVTHVRRRSCVQGLKRSRGGKLIETAGFLQGVPSKEYMSYLVHAKAVPCPSGPRSCDTARPLSAMEAGAVPILDLLKPEDPQFDYWNLVFGDHPIPTIYDWGQASVMIDDVEKQWDYLSTQVYAFWQQWKRSTARQLNADIREVANALPFAATADELITVIITSSPIPSHPSTEILEETVASVRAQLPLAEIVIVFDGVRPEDKNRSKAYYEYVRRALWKCNFEWHNVVPVVMRQWGHQANSTREALKFVGTDVILFVEHDTPICGDVPWQDMIDVIQSGEANAIRLHQDVDIHPDHEHIMASGVMEVNGLRMRKTSAWWQRPHLASTQLYSEFLEDFFPPSARTMIEDRLYSPVWVDCVEGRWEKWKLWVYTPEGNMQRSRHLDGRDGAPKYDMDYGLA